MRVRQWSDSARDLGVVEHLDDPVRSRGEICEYLQDKLPVNGKPRTLEGYLRGDYNIVARRIDVDGPHYGIVLKAIPNGHDLEAVPERVWRHYEARGYYTNADQPLVLSHDVETVNGEECVIPSLVGLEAFDDSFVHVGKPIYFFDGRATSLRQLRSASHDGKIHVCWRHMAFALGEFHHENVERASDAMNDHAHLDIDEWTRLLHIREPNNLLAHLRVWFLAESVRGIVLPGYDLGVQEIDLGYGPV